jgi:hypothetical protein
MTRNLGTIFVGVTRCSNNHGLFVLGAKGRDTGRGGVRAKINDHIALCNGRTEVIALINLSNDLQLGKMFRTRYEHASHSAF